VWIDIAYAATAVVIGLLALRFWYNPPFNSAALPPQSLRGDLHGKPKSSRILLIDDGLEAFAARRSLIRSAEVSIDVQYYIWRNDLTGKLLLFDVIHAADRGVTVRLLIDDNSTAGNDFLLAAAAQHKNIALKLFNPYTMRSARPLNFLLHFRRLNRRMHNKSLTVDSRATIVGGRNIGDAYFSAHENMHFADVDVYVEGGVVADVATAFEAYWTSASAYNASVILPPVEPNAIDNLRLILQRDAGEDSAQYYEELLKAARFDRMREDSKHVMENVPVTLAVDSPAKGLGSIPRRQLLLGRFEKILGDVSQSLDVATAYFVPGHFGSNFLSNAALDGKYVRVLTNSLASNDVLPVHAGYARYRKRLLRSGVKLHELRPEKEILLPKRSRRRLPKFGAAASSLHAKIFVLDRKRVFIGSFNFDPRSLYLNCEMGLLIESPELGHIITKRLDEAVAARTFEPFLESGNRLSWKDNQQNTFKVEPDSTWRQRVVAWVISWLPVEWLL
jgi:putative cardiolipin synthase